MPKKELKEMTQMEYDRYFDLLDQAINLEEKRYHRLINSEIVPAVDIYGYFYIQGMKEHLKENTDNIEELTELIDPFSDSDEPRFHVMASKMYLAIKILKRSIEEIQRRFIIIHESCKTAGDFDCACRRYSMEPFINSDTS